jgi:hypothetical protein
MLAVEALFDMNLLNCRPSMVAATLLYAERRLRGAVPFWPTSLAKMTGYEDLTTPEIACAVRTAQKLCRKGVYADHYKRQMTENAEGAVGGRKGGVTAAAVAMERLMLTASDSATLPGPSSMGFAATPAAIAGACGSFSSNGSLSVLGLSPGQLLQLPTTTAGLNVSISSSSGPVLPIEAMGNLGASSWSTHSLPLPQQGGTKSSSQLPSLLVPIQQGQQQDMQTQQGLGDQQQGNLLLLSDTAMATLRGSLLGAVGTSTGRQMAMVQGVGARGVSHGQSQMRGASLGELQALEHSGQLGQGLGLGMVSAPGSAAAPQSQATQGLEGLALSLQALGITSSSLGQMF